MTPLLMTPDPLTKPTDPLAVPWGTGVGPLSSPACRYLAHGRGALLADGELTTTGRAESPLDPCESLERGCVGGLI